MDILVILCRLYSYKPFFQFRVLQALPIYGAVEVVTAGIATSIKCASFMVLLSITMSALLLWIVQSVMDLSSYSL